MSAITHLLGWCCDWATIFPSKLFLFCASFLNALLICVSTLRTPELCVEGLNNIGRRGKLRAHRKKTHEFGIMAWFLFRPPTLSVDRSRMLFFTVHHLLLLLSAVLSAAWKSCLCFRYYYDDPRLEALEKSSHGRVHGPIRRVSPSPKSALKRGTGQLEFHPQRGILTLEK